jgi:TRAP-type C4-dicarboxylate transport system permease small subunit
LKRFLQTLDRAGRWIENALMSILLGGMILIAFGQIVLRNGFDSGMSWADPVLRILVLWIGMLGAVAASRENRHITIDILNRLLPLNFRRWSEIVVALFTTLVCGLLVWHTFRFVQDEFQYSNFEVAGLPVWLWQAVMPVGFGLIAWRYLVRAAQLVSGSEDVVIVREMQP